MTPAPRRLAPLALSLAALACSSSGTPAPDGGPGGPLTAPTGLVATASPSSPTVQLTWTAEAAATGGYQIWRGVNGDDLSQLSTSSSNGYLDTIAPPGSALAYTVRAVGASGVSGDSNVATALTIPAAPTALAATAITDSSITISWTEAAGAQGGDEVTYRTGNEAATTSAATGPSFTAANLLPDTAYTFSVIARDATGSGPAATASFSTRALGGGGDGGNSPDAGDGGDGGISNDGGENSNDGGSDAGGGNSNDAGNSNDGGSSNDGGNGGGPDGGTASDGGAGPGDAFAVSAYGSDSLIILQWADQGAASYQIFRADNQGGYAQIGSSAATNFADTGGGAHPISANAAYSYYVVPLDGAGNPQPASSAAATTARGVAVQESDQYIDDVSSTAVAPDFTQGITTAALSQTLQLVPAYPDGGLDTDLDDAVQSFGSSDGHAVFPGVPAAPYLLYATSPAIYSYLPAGARALDLSTAFVGRRAQDPINGDGPTVQLSLTGLDPWDVNDDSIQAFSWGANDSSWLTQPVDALLTPLADGGTSAAGSFASSDVFTNLVESSQGDLLTFVQEELDQSGANPYFTVRRAYATGSANFQGASVSISGAMVGTPTISQSLQVDLAAQGGASAFLTYASAVNPSATYGDPSSVTPYGATIIGAEPDYATHGAYGVLSDSALSRSSAPPQLWYGAYDDQSLFAPALLYGLFPGGSANVAFGASGQVNFVNPFPARWDLFLIAYVPFSVQLEVDGAPAGPITGRLQTQGLYSSYVGAQGIAIGPRVSPVTDPRINGAPANASGNAELGPLSASAPLVFSWGAPAIGAPTRYTVTIWQIVGGQLTGEPAVVLQTSTTSATLPAGVLDEGSPYAAFITATESDIDRFGGGVLAYDGDADFADCITSAFTVQ